MQGTARGWAAGCYAARGKWLRLACMCSSDGSQHVSRPGALSITTQHPGAGERTAQAPEAHPPPPTYLQHAACAHQLLHQVDAVGDAQQQQAGVWGVGQHKQTLHQLLALGACTGQAHASSGCYWASTRKLQLLPVGNSGRTTWGSPPHAGGPSVLCPQLVHHSTSHPPTHPPVSSESSSSRTTTIQLRSPAPAAFAAAALSPPADLRLCPRPALFLPLPRRPAAGWAAGPAAPGSGASARRCSCCRGSDAERRRVLLLAAAAAAPSAAGYTIGSSPAARAASEGMSRSVAAGGAAVNGRHVPSHRPSHRCGHATSAMIKWHGGQLRWAHNQVIASNSSNTEPPPGCGAEQACEYPSRMRSTTWGWHMGSRCGNHVRRADAAGQDQTMCMQLAALQQPERHTLSGRKSTRCQHVLSAGMPTPPGSPLAC